MNKWKSIYFDLSLWDLVSIPLFLVRKTKREGELQDDGGVRRGDHLPPHKYIRNTSKCGTTTTEHLLNTGRRPQTSQKARNSPTYLGRAIGKRKNRDKRIRTGTAPVGGSCEGGKFPHTRKPLYRQRQGVVGEKLQSHGGECSNRGAEGKAEIFPHRGSVPTSTHQTERLVCSPTRAGEGWALRLGFRRPDPRERTGVGCVNTIWRGLVHHS